MLVVRQDNQIERNKQPDPMLPIHRFDMSRVEKINVEQNNDNNNKVAF